MSSAPPRPPDGLVVLLTDNHLLVVDKPAGLLTQAATAGDDNLVDRARAWLVATHDKPGNAFVGLVHRLDRNVSGVVVLARTSKAASRLSDAFRTRRVEKTYLAVVVGAPPAEGVLEHRLADGPERVAPSPQGKPARLRFTRLADDARHGLAVLEVDLDTGRKHQIRAQLAAAGFPLLGDPRYGARSPLIARPALHAWRVAFPHPVGAAPVSVEAPVPADLARVLERVAPGRFHPAPS
ncbi:MAG: RNA pseudouridine synthase [Myxococcales bacterium]|nr:RNA pseudouridine synthase [Myxococcales bacterium]MCB9736230.1 RNA pseudouridine synthase [Deltaproteobacteria bacterium]